MIPEYELRQMYCDDKMTQLEIAEVYGVNQTTISNQLKKYRVETRTLSESHLNGISVPSREELYDMYWVREMSLSEIVDEIGATPRTVSNWIKKYGIKIRTVSEAQLKGSRKLSKEELYDMYWYQSMSLSEIAKDIGVNQVTIGYWMKKHGIETRNNSESRLNGNFTGERSGGWRGGISGGKYCYKFNNIFKEAVRRRDDYTCQLCRYEQKPNDQKLDVHHIHYDKANCWPDVVALCRSCNSKVNGNRDYWEQYFENQLSNRRLICWSLQQ